GLIDEISQITFPTSVEVAEEQKLALLLENHPARIVDARNSAEIASVVIMPCQKADRPQDELEGLHSEPTRLDRDHMCQLVLHEPAVIFTVLQLSERLELRLALFGNVVRFGPLAELHRAGEEQARNRDDASGNHDDGPERRPV